MVTSSKINLYQELQELLPSSDGNQRKSWAKTIVENDIDLLELSDLLFCEKKIALRFSWLLSDIGMISPKKLRDALPDLLQKSEQVDHFPFVESFATYWQIAGVPESNESQAIDHLFGWIISGDTNTTTKSRSAKTLFQLAQKYPDLKNELSISLKSQIGKYSRDFDKKMLRLLTRLGND